MPLNMMKKNQKRKKKPDFKLPKPQEIKEQLEAAGLRVNIDDRDIRPGKKFNDWEMGFYIHTRHNQFPNECYTLHIIYLVGQIQDSHRQAKKRLHSEKMRLWS